MTAVLLVVVDADMVGGRNGDGVMGGGDNGVVGGTQHSALSDYSTMDSHHLDGPFFSHGLPGRSQPNSSAPLRKALSPGTASANTWIVLERDRRRGRGYIGSCEDCV